MQRSAPVGLRCVIVVENLTGGCTTALNNAILAWTPSKRYAGVRKRPNESLVKNEN